MRIGSIYVVTNNVTGDQYVGQTRQKAARRWKTHINTANSAVAPKYKLASAILQYGKDAFSFSEVFTAFDTATLNAVEILFIKELSPAYNITKGGAGHRGVTPSEQVCRSRSERLKRQWEDPVWRERQLIRLKESAKINGASERGKRVAAVGNAARWANHTKKLKPAPRVKATQEKRDLIIGRFLSARAKWKPVYCPELQCSFLSQKAAAEYLGVLRTSVTNAVKQKGRVMRKFALEPVA